VRTSAPKKIGDFLGIAKQEMQSEDGSMQDSPQSQDSRFHAPLQRLRAQTLALRKTSSSVRVEKLRKLERAIHAHLDEFYLALQADFKKPAAEVDVTEIFPVLTEINEFCRNLDEWMQPQWRATPTFLMGASSEVRFEPKGLVLIIGPWNYPVNLCLAPLVAAIAAGNAVVLKPSELTPNTTNVLRKMLSTVVGEDEFLMIEGDAGTTQELLKEPFDHIFFTGSTKVGRIVMEAAAKHLTSVTLELGGKSPVIIDRDSDLKQAARSIVWGKFINSGQTCVAPDYILIPADQTETFVSECQNVLTQFYGEESSRERSPDFCRIINDRNFLRLTTLLDQAISQGAKVATGGTRNAKDRYIAPTLLTNVGRESPIMSEEIFGPILPILNYTSLEEDALPWIRKQGKPLALYVFSNNAKNTEIVLEGTSAGGSCVNATVIHLGNAELPFGGVGPSGQGSYHGHAGFKAFSHERSILKQSKLTLLSFFFPPYTPKVRSLIKLTMRFFS
jgi:aldehyde dehydrogenase (NAD+)